MHRFPSLVLARVTSIAALALQLTAPLIAQPNDLTLTELETFLAQLQDAQARLEVAAPTMDRRVVQHELERASIQLAEIARHTGTRALHEEIDTFGVERDEATRRFTALLEGTAIARQRLHHIRELPPRGADEPNRAASAAVLGSQAPGEAVPSRAAAIRGQVKGQGSGPVPRVLVRAADLDGGWLATTVTDAQGRYDLRVPAGNGYQLETSNREGFIDQRRRVGRALQGATRRADFALAAGGTLAGSVTEDGTGAPVLARVQILEPIVLPDGSPSLQNVGSVLTDVSGSYVTPAVSAGTYYLLAVSETHALEMWPDRLVPRTWFYTEPVPGAIPIQLSDGDALTGFDFELTPYGTVSGTVTEAATGQPVPFAKLTITARHSHRTHMVFADVAGHYTSLPRPEGPYDASASATGFVDQCWDGHDNCRFYNLPGDGFAIVNATDRTGVDFAMGHPATLSGTLRVDGVLTSGGLHPFTPEGRWEQIASSGSDGHFSFTLPAGSYYLEAQRAGAAGQVYPGVPCAAQCDRTRGELIQVAAGEVRDDLHFDLDSSGDLEVWIAPSAPTGFPIVPYPVGIYDATGMRVGGGSNWHNSQITPIPFRLSPGSYTVRTEGLDLAFTNEIHDGIPCSPTCPPLAGTPVSVTAGATASIDFQLDATPPSTMGQLLITVQEAQTGNPPVQSVTVWIYDRAETHIDTGTATQSNGSAAQFSFPEGQYYVATRYPHYPYEGQVYPQVPCYDSSCNVHAGTLVRVRAGQTTQIDLDLRLRPIHRDGFEDGTTGWTLRHPH